MDTGTGEQAPPSQRETAFKLIDAAWREGRVDPRPVWKAGRIFLGKPSHQNSPAQPAKKMG
jgi:hypothetical protein